MPILLGLILIERRFLLGEHAYCFPLLDTSMMVILLSLIYEELFPMISNGFTKDYYDYISYALGGLLFYFFINKPVLTIGKKNES